MASLKMAQCLPLVMLTVLTLHGFAQDTPQAMRAYEIFRELVMRFVDNRPPAQRHIQTLRSMDRLQPAAPAEFPCAAAARAPWRRSAERPTSAHRVRPGDEDVVAAMGDSLSVGWGLAATKLTEVIIEARGWSFSAGGQGTWREFLTLPNILKEFNPNLTGYAVQDALSHQKASRFNVAEGGAISSDMPLQARNLVKRMRADPDVDLQNDWKMVTLMIGSNDFCGFVCLEEDMNATVRRHGEDLERALDHLQASLPRTIVNLIVTPKDCFHLSQKGIAMGANGLWMNLLESDDEKSTTLPDPAFSRFLCPTEERPFISTWGNNGGRGPS